MALLWGEKMLEIDRYCVGEYHPDYIEKLEVVKQLRLVVENARPIDEVDLEWFCLRGQPTDSCLVM